ncbi:hypothetical protein ACKZDW_02615 (plasmid) [Ralstonia syzygii subsp. celebesensis]|uniref:hypothetical protein n=1 Tax=Ralstonia syzygii TaxID=28097 RepID=UPI00387E1CAF
MKKLIALCIAMCAAMLAACATAPTGQPSTLPTPAQVAAQVCPSAQAVLAVLTVPGAIDPAVAADLATATPIVNAVCAAGATVTVLDLHSLAANGLPAILKIIQASPLPDKDKQAAVLGVAAAQAALAPIIAANTATSSVATPASASSAAQAVPAASAPAAQ